MYQLTRQTYHYHPTNVSLSPDKRITITRQTYHYHPNSILKSWTYSNLKVLKVLKIN